MKLRNGMRRKDCSGWQWEWGNYLHILYMTTVGKERCLPSAFRDLSIKVFTLQFIA